MSLFNIGGCEYIRTYVIPSHFRHNDSRVFHWWLYPRTTFSFPYLFLLPLCWNWPCPHFQHTPWFREFLSVMYPCASNPLLNHWTSRIDILSKISWKIHKHAFCAALCDQHIITVNPVLHKKIPYINVPWVPGAWFIPVPPIIIHFKRTLVLWEWNSLFDVISLGFYK